MSAFELGRDAAEADWLDACEEDDPMPDSCPAIQSDADVEAWREGYAQRLAELRKDQP